MESVRSRAARRRWGYAVLGLISIAVLASACVALRLQAPERDQRDRTRARAALIAYFGHVRDGDWHLAYQQLDELSNCTEAEYVDFLKEQPRLRSFTVGAPAGPSSNIDGTFVTFPVDLTYANGKREGFDMDVGIDTDGIGPVDGPGWRSS
ncbi:MAG TPA: hypothetical protein VE198_01295 [Actinoallomurus sp.]|nr:hypothetical protein [Actinoallomurus sp.]